MPRTMTITLRVVLDDLKGGERATHAAEANLKFEDLPSVADLDLDEIRSFRLIGRKDW